MLTEGPVQRVQRGCGEVGQERDVCAEGGEERGGDRGEADVVESAGGELSVG